MARVSICIHVFSTHVKSNRPAFRAFAFSLHPSLFSRHMYDPYGGSTKNVSRKKTWKKPSYTRLYTHQYPIPTRTYWLTLTIINDINRYNRYIPTISKPSSHLSLFVFVFFVWALQTHTQFQNHGVLLGHRRVWRLVILTMLNEMALDSHDTKKKMIICW